MNLKKWFFVIALFSSITYFSQAPGQITDLVASNTTETGTQLDWSIPSGTITEYRIYQDASEIAIIPAPTVTYNVTALTANTTYSFTIIAFNLLEGSPESNPTIVSTDITPPNAPDDLTSSNITYSSAELNWSPVSDNVGVIDYQIFQDDVLIDTSSGFSSFNVEELEELTIYRFKVKAVDAAGNTSELSNVEIVETPKESGESYFTNLNANLISVDWNAKDILAVGNVGIGVSPDPSYRLAVAGNVIAEEVRVALQANWPDYVFADNYNLKPISEVEQFIKEYGHLENIPNAKDAELNGISLGEMNAKLLEKIEELTLYIIQQEKKINDLEENNKELDSIKVRLLQIEQLLEK